MEKLKITKENYKGYVELYTKKFNDKGKLVYKGINSFGISFALSTVIIPLSLVLTGFPTAISVLGLHAVAGGLCTKSYLKYKKELNKLKQKYPYIDISLSEKVIEEALLEEKVFILDDGFIVNNIGCYEKYLKCEETLETITKDNYSKIDYTVSICQEEVHNALDKQKVLKLTKNYK